MLVDTEYYIILRRYQMENLRSYDEDEWPSKAELQAITSSYPDDMDYYNPEDLFLPLGVWLRNKNIGRRREMTAKKKKTLQPPQAAM